MEIIKASTNNNQIYYCREYDQNDKQCFPSTKYSEYGNTCVFKVPYGHYMVIEYRTNNPDSGPPNVDMCSVRVNNNLTMGPMTPGVCNGVNARYVTLVLDKIHNGISFSRQNRPPVVFVIRPLQFGVPARPMALVHPGAAAGNNAFVHSLMNAPGHNMTLQQIDNHTDKKCRELVAEIHQRIYDYYATDGKLSASQWNDIEKLLR